jgi:hypothetical protein
MVASGLHHPLPAKAYVVLGHMQTDLSSRVKDSIEPIFGALTPSRENGALSTGSRASVQGQHFWVGIADERLVPECVCGWRRYQSVHPQRQHLWHPVEHNEGSRQR